MDKKAVKILLKTMKHSQDECLENWFYWDRYMKFITDDEFEYAKSHSVMFEPEKISHNEICTRIKNAVDHIEKQDVVNAFIYSLSTRQLEYRSFLSSYCIGKSLIEHDYVASPEPNSTICAVCGLHRFEFEDPIEFNTMNYFKYKHGSCTVNLISVLFDLEQFPRLPVVKPSEIDFSILNQLKSIIEHAQPNDRIAQLKKRIAQAVKSNDEERLGLLEIFGVIGILHDDEHFGYVDQYVTYPERVHRPIRNDDVNYPTRWWQGKFGVDQEKWDYWFKSK
ncbi:hypothetical protein I9191_16475 [Acinetobacter bereziniae]|nr:hypothetical protein [Acinetobacter bereziniae]